MAKKPIGSRSLEDFDIFNRDDNSWRDRASCKGTDTSVFFGSPKSSEINIAKDICKKCPVNSSCLQSALTYQYHGIWGGTTEEERTYIIKKVLNNDLSSLDAKQCKKILSMI
jgi:WhiB family redox-sensing transcriptional regulator